MTHLLGSWIVHTIGLGMGMVLGWFMRDWIADLKAWIVIHREWLMERRP